jgi:hypothetical protein
MMVFVARRFVSPRFPLLVVVVCEPAWRASPPTSNKPLPLPQPQHTGPTMDPQRVVRLINASYDDDNDKRKAAEAQLMTVSMLPGFCMCVLQIISSPKIPMEILKSSAVLLKNQVATRHAVDNERSTPHWLKLSDHERHAIRNSIVEAVVTVDSSVRKLLMETVCQITTSDFPANWPELTSQLEALIKSQKPERMGPALQLLVQLAKSFQFRLDVRSRAPVTALVKPFMPLMAVLLKHLVPNNSLAAAVLMKNMIKAYCFLTTSSNAYRIEVSPSFMVGWFGLLKQLIDKKLPEASENLEPRDQPTDPAERDAWPWWKVKKWALRACHKNFRSFYRLKVQTADESDPGTAPEQVLSKTFIEHVAPQLLQSVLGVMALRSRNSYCPEDVLDEAFKFILPSLEAGNVFALLKPHMASVIFQVIFRVVCFSPERWRDWQENPEEYVARDFELMEECTDARESATMVVSDAVKCRPPVYDIVLKGVVDGFKRLLVQPPSAARTYQEYGLICIFTSVHGSNTSLSTTDPNDAQKRAIVEQVLVKCVHPHLRNRDAPFMRRAACICVSRHAGFSFSHAHHLQVSVQGLLLNLRSTAKVDLPVRVEAACSLQHFLDAEVCQEVVRPILKEVLQALFTMMDIVPIDEVVSTLEKIISNYGDALLPVCSELTVKLLQTFATYTVRSRKDDDDAVAMAAYACVECVSTLFEKMQSHPQVYPVLERHTLPFLHQILDPSGEAIEFLEQGLRIIAWTAQCGPSVSPQLWELFPKIQHAFEFWATVRPRSL